MTSVCMCPVWPSTSCHSIHFYVYICFHDNATSYFQALVQKNQFGSITICFPHTSNKADNCSHLKCNPSSLCCVKALTLFHISINLFIPFYVSESVCIPPADFFTFWLCCLHVFLCIAQSGGEVTHLFKVTRSDPSVSHTYLPQKFFSCVPCHILSLTHTWVHEVLLLCLRWTNWKHSATDLRLDMSPCLFLFYFYWTSWLSELYIGWSESVSGLGFNVYL